LSAKEKQQILDTGKCYVCEDLELEHAGFAGYEGRDVAQDHYQIPFGNVGGSGETLSIHAAAGGSTPDDDDFEVSTRRNCHRLRRNDHNSRKGYVKFLQARMQARQVEFLDDVLGNVGRDPGARKYQLQVRWADREAEFVGKKYPVVLHERSGKKWRRFMVALPANLLFTDDTAQARPANRKKIIPLILTFLGEGYPVYAPVNARVDKCGHIVLFDGNHRATANAIAFGVDDLLPVLIWDIEPGDVCALRPDLAIKNRTTKNGRRKTKA
jgi:hypothetical protein